MQPLDHRGLGVVEVSCKLSSLHIMWVKCFLSSEYRGWQSFFHFYLWWAFLCRTNQSSLRPLQCKQNHTLPITTLLLRGPHSLGCCMRHSSLQSLHHTKTKCQLTCTSQSHCQEHLHHSRLHQQQTTPMHHQSPRTWTWPGRMAESVA